MTTMIETLDGLKHYNLYINGQWTKSTSAKYVDVLNPSNEELLARVTAADESDIDLALSTSDEAAKKWKLLTPIERGVYLTKLCRALEEKKAHFAEILVKEQGKTYANALGEVADTIAYMEDAVASAGRIKGDILPSRNSNQTVLVKKVPYGVTLGLCAWNYPLALVGRKVGPALITGNTMIVKPHELTPLATIEFFQLVHDVGFPPGVLNLITGDGPEAGSQLVASPMTKLISVTGSVRAGQSIYKTASANIAGLVLELGGKAPFIVLEDADIDAAVEAAAVARYANCGQVCVCADMAFVHESVIETFTNKLIEKVKKIKVGDPFDSSTEMGPKVSSGDIQKMERIIAETVDQGGKVALGGHRPEGKAFEKGYWFEPTILTEVTPSMTAAKEEIFGPIMPIIAIKSLDEAIQLTNDSPYGLAAYLFSDDQRNYIKASEQMEVGTIYYNQGIDGLFHVYHSGHKLSGLGGEDGEYGIEGYLQKRTIYMNHNL